MNLTMGGRTMLEDTVVVGGRCGELWDWVWEVTVDGVVKSDPSAYMGMRLGRIYVCMCVCAYMRKLFTSLCYAQIPPLVKCTFPSSLYTLKGCNIFIEVSNIQPANITQTNCRSVAKFNLTSKCIA